MALELFALLAEAEDLAGLAQLIAESLHLPSQAGACLLEVLVIVLASAAQDPLLVPVSAEGHPRVVVRGLRRLPVPLQ